MYTRTSRSTYKSTLPVVSQKMHAPSDSFDLQALYK